jgi:hypothetical protein
MTDERADLLAREGSGWTDFADLAAGVPVEARDRPELRDGWSATGVLWHVGAWMERAAGKLEEIAAGTWEPEPVDLDERNARLLAESRDVTWDLAWERLTEARARIRPAFERVPDLDEHARGYFVNDTIEHYEEHGADLRGVGGGDAHREHG